LRAIASPTNRRVTAMQPLFAVYSVAGLENEYGDGSH